MEILVVELAFDRKDGCQLGLSSGKERAGIEDRDLQIRCITPRKRL